MQASRWHQDLFFQYPLTPFQTSCGQVDLPILYYDDSVLMALYLVDVDKAAPLVTDPRLEVLPVLGRQTLVGLAFYQYRETAIAPYNEVGVGITVVPKGARPAPAPLLTMLRPLDKNVAGFHIIDLPVTTEAACAAGREIWGYPKFVTPIGFELDGKRFRGSVTEPGTRTDMLVLEGRMGLSVPGPLLDLVLYSAHEGHLLRTLVNTRGGAQICQAGNLRLHVSPSSQHPMATRLRQLGLPGAKPMLVCASDKLQLRLNAGAPVPVAPA